MEETLVCEICQQAWDASEGEKCILCDRVGRPSDEMVGDLPRDTQVYRPARRREPGNYVRLSVKKEYVFPLLRILYDEIARVESVPLNERAETDGAMLACAGDLVKRLKRGRK